MSHTREQFARAFLKEVGAPATERNLYALVAWMQAEGGTADNNPLNTTHQWPNSWLLAGNTAGVREYRTYEDGVAATAETLNYGADRGLYKYKGIRESMRRDKPAYRTLFRVERSTWGTGGLALLCLPWVKLSWEKYRNMPIPPDAAPTLRARLKSLLAS